MGRGNRLAMRTWLAGHGCRPVDVAPGQATGLAFGDDRAAERLFPALLGSQVGAFAIRV